MIKNLFTIAIVAFVAMTIISCSKGNPKNSTDNFKNLIVGKWLNTADTTYSYTNGALVNKSVTGLTTDFYVFNADGTIGFITGGVSYPGTFSLSNYFLTINTAPFSGGGITLPATTIVWKINSLTDKELVLFNDNTTSTQGIPAIPATATTPAVPAVPPIFFRTVQTTYFKKQ